MAIKYYAGNKLTGVASDTKPTSNIIDGSTFFVTDTEDLFMYDLGTTAWKVVSGNTIAETLSNKTFSDHILVAEISAPSTPASGYGSIYAKSDNKLYFKNDAGTEVDLTNQASGGESNQNAFSTVVVSGQSDVVADAATDTLTLVAGSNMTITTAAGSDTVTFAASGSGTVTVTDNENTNENNLISFVANAATATGTHGLEMDGDLHYNPSTGTVTSTVFVGALTGNATTATTLATARTIGGTSFDGSAAIVPATITVADTTDTTAFVALFNSATGDLAPKTDAGVTYNAGTGTLTATAFVGPITGNVTGDASGTAATVTGAAQTAITSVGTLTGLDLTSGDKTIFATVGNNTLTVGASNTTVNIAGDLTVSGDATTFNTATVSVEDPLMILASNNSAADAVDIGFYGLYDTSGSLDLYSGIFRDANDSGKWKLFKDLQAAPTTTVNTSGTGYAVGTLVANLEGDVTGDVTGSAGTSTGLAGSATILATGRTISASGDITWTSASFNGSANVTSVAAITADVIINADIKSDAAIAYSKLATLADGNILVGNGSNVATSVNPSGDIDVTNAGVFSIASDSIINADVKSDAAIVDTKLATIATADKVSIAALDIDGAAEIGAAIVDADVFIIDDGAGGTNRKVLASRIKTYAAGAAGASESFAIAMAVAL